MVSILLMSGLSSTIVNPLIERTIYYHYLGISNYLTPGSSAAESVRAPDPYTIQTAGLVIFLEM